MGWALPAKDTEVRGQPPLKLMVEQPLIRHFQLGNVLWEQLADGSWYFTEDSGTRF